MNRFCICVFYEKDGIVRDYFLYYVKELQKIANKVIVVANGLLSNEGKTKLETLGVDILIRENKGLDFGAWKVAMTQIGFDELSKYDELILTNNSCYGPIYPFSEMFDEMSKRDCDFWGITKHSETRDYIIPKDKKTKVLEHLQSYFWVFKQHMVVSETFQSYWKNLKMYDDYKKVVGYQEIQFTKYFEQNNFKSDSYIDINIHKNLTSNPTVITDILLQNVRLPLIKRKLFTENYFTLLAHGIPYHNKKVLEYIKRNTNYNTDFIYKDLIETQPMSKIVSNLSGIYNLSSSYNENITTNLKTALVLYIYYEDNVEYCLNYAASMPQNSDIYIISSKETTLDICKKSEILKGYNVIYTLKENRGRDVSAYLITAKDVFKNYELICCVHDKKSPHSSGIYGYDFQYQCFEACLKNISYVKNIINTFEQEKFLGLLSPLPINFMGVNTIGNELGINLDILKKICIKLDLKVPFDYHPPVPFGSMFWIRGNAIEPLFRYNWQYEDFPEEPLPDDGTISHVIERIYSYIAQEAGFYTAYVCPETFVPVYMTSLLENTKASNNLIYKIFGVKNIINLQYNEHYKLTFKKLLKKILLKKRKYKILNTLRIQKKYYQKQYHRYTKLHKLLSYHNEADQNKV